MPVRHSGIWHPVVTVGRTVVEGEQIGKIRDYSGAVVRRSRLLPRVRGVRLAGPPVREQRYVHCHTRRGF